MKHLLIVYHSKTGHTQRLIDAVKAGAQDAAEDGVILRCKTAAQADESDLRWAHGLILGTPENFGYMSGAMKDFFDRTFYEVEGQLAPLPYALVVGAENDGTGAVRAIERIVNGYPFVAVADPIISRLNAVKASETDTQAPTSTTLQQCKDLGATLAAGLQMGIF